jgi:hypothetical protein
MADARSGMANMDMFFQLPSEVWLTLICFFLFMQMTTTSIRVTITAKNACMTELCKAMGLLHAPLT